MSRPVIELPNLHLVTDSIRKTLVMPDWEPDWGPYYFQHLGKGTLSVYDKDNTKLDPMAYPAFGYMLSSTELKKNRIVYENIIAVEAKLDLLDIKLDKYQGSFNQLYEYTLLLEQDTKRWQWAAFGEGCALVLLLAIIVVL